MIDTMMRIERMALLALLTAATVVSCHKEDSSCGCGTRRPMEVRIDAATTRTALGDDGLSVKWTKGDRLALWACNGGAAVFEAVPFRFWYRTGAPDRGMFVGTVDPMPAGTYDYYGASPLPEATDGTRVSYTIPEVQSGAWDSRYDIMLAATQGAGLQEDILNEVNLHFRHKTHALKITIPEGRNRLGRPIAKLRIDFGRPVAGRMTWDIAAPDAAPEMAATSNAVTLDFATPVGEGDAFWVYIAPADLRGAEVKFTATDGTEYSWPLTASGFDDCRAGVVTPVTLTIREARPQREYRLTADPAHLGEPVTRVDSIVMPEGYEFPSLELDCKTRAIASNPDGTFSFRTFADQPFAAGSVGMGVESENTEGVYGTKCEVTSVTENACTVMAPYLFFEDFSGITSFDAGSNHGIGNPTATDLSPYNLPGWYGARAEGKAGKAVRIRINSNGLIHYPARIDSRPVGGIKPGRRVKARVTFNADAYNKSPDKMRCKAGTSNGQGGFAGNDSNNTIATLTIAENSSAGFDNILGEYDYTIPDCTAETCLSWNYTKESGFVSGYTSMFMDNIRVTIVQ